MTKKFLFVIFSEDNKKNRRYLVSPSSLTVRRFLPENGRPYVLVYSGTFLRFTMPVLSGLRLDVRSDSKTAKSPQRDGAEQSYWLGVKERCPP